MKNRWRECRIDLFFFTPYSVVYLSGTMRLKQQERVVIRARIYDLTPILPIL